MSADDGIHAVGYDAVVITAAPAIRIGIGSSGNNIELTWSGRSPPYVLEESADLSTSGWSEVMTTSLQNVTWPATNAAAFFRVRQQ